MKIKYYLIHGVDKSRGPRMISEFEKWGLEKTDVMWMLIPNKDEISMNMRKVLLNQATSESCGIRFPEGCPNIGNGQVSCTFKHYLCLKNIIENNYDYGVIMEDNQFFAAIFPKLLKNI
jgi:hypothetical protein